MGSGTAFVIGLVVAGGCIAGWEYLERKPKPRAATRARQQTRWKARGPGYYALLYNYPQGDPDRRLKGFDGPFANRVDANRAADREERSWYTSVKKLVNDPRTLGM